MKARLVFEIEYPLDPEKLHDRDECRFLSNAEICELEEERIANAPLEFLTEHGWKPTSVTVTP